MDMYEITKGTEEQRQQVREWLYGLDYLSEDKQEKVITAWLTAWQNSVYDNLEDMAYSSLAPSYTLKSHVNEVTKFGILLAENAVKEWGYETDFDELVQILILHDVDKPYLYVIEDGNTVKSEYAQQIQHGVLGAMILKDLGFSDKVISTVATHATNSPFHGNTFEAYVLHYADLFSSDHALRLDNVKPFYQVRLM